LGRNFDGDGWTRHIIEGTQRRREIPHRELALLQFTDDRVGGSLAQRERGMLGSRPRAEGATIIFSKRKQCRIHANPAPTRSCMQRDVDCGVIGIREYSALFERKVRV
jgi:hypothetical protein